MTAILATRPETKLTDAQIANMVADASKGMLRELSKNPDLRLRAAALNELVKRYR